MRETQSVVTNFYSASECARRLNFTTPRFLRHIHSGAIQPDATVMDSRLFLFKADRLEQIRDRINTLSEMPEETPVAA